MDRRTFLGAAGSTGLLSIAGCTAVASHSTLDDPEFEREEDGETHLRYSTDGNDLLTVTVQPGRQRQPADGDVTLPVDVSIWHRTETTIASLRLKLRAPPSGADVPAQIALTAPPWNPHPSIELYTDRRDGGTIMEIDDMSAQGDGTATFEFIVTALPASIDELLVDVSVSLDGEGIFDEDYTIEGRSRVPLPGTE